MSSFEIKKIELPASLSLDFSPDNREKLLKKIETLILFSFL